MFYVKYLCCTSLRTNCTALKHTIYNTEIAGTSTLLTLHLGTGSLIIALLEFFLQSQKANQFLGLQSMPLWNMLGCLLGRDISQAINKNSLSLVPTYWGKKIQVFLIFPLTFGIYCFVSFDVILSSMGYSNWVHSSCVFSLYK